MTPEQVRTIARLHRFIVIGLCICAGNLMICAGIMIFRAVNTTAAPGSNSPNLLHSKNQESAVSHQDEEKEGLPAVVSTTTIIGGASGTDLLRSRTLQEAPSFPEGSVIAEWIYLHPNGPHKLIPKTATQAELDAYAREAGVIISDWQEQRDRLLEKHHQNLITFCEDPDVAQNDKDRQARMLATVRSIWP